MAAKDLLPPGTQRALGADCQRGQPHPLRLGRPRSGSMWISAQGRARWLNSAEWDIEGTSGFCNARDGRLEAVRMGRGEPLVLLPGLAGGWRLVAPLARKLARTHTVYILGL